MSTTVDSAMAANVAETVAAVLDLQPGQFMQIRNARELGKVSQMAQQQGCYDAAFEDKLAFCLHHSMKTGGYKRTSVPTNPPANIIASLRSRV